MDTVTVRICPRCTCAHADAPTCVACGLVYVGSARARKRPYKPNEYNRAALTHLLQSLRKIKSNGN